MFNYLYRSLKIKRGYMKNILIAYYSHSGNTKKIAEKIQEKTNADIFRIEPIKEYPNDYRELVNLAQKEKLANFHPELKSKLDNISKYDIIFIGTPVWWYTMASPVRTFIKEYNLENKIIAPFCTHGGGGEASTFEEFSKFLPKSKVINGLSLYETPDNKTDGKIEEWIKLILNN